MKSKSFPFRREWFDALMRIPKHHHEIFREAFTVLCNYGLNGNHHTEVRFEVADLLEEHLPPLVKQSLRQHIVDHDGKHIWIKEMEYRRATELQLETWRNNGHHGQKGKEFGRLGGRPKKTENPLEIENNPLENDENPLQNPLAPHTIFSNQNIKERVKSALEKSALGYSTTIMHSKNSHILKHVPPNIKAVKMVLDENYVPAETRHTHPTQQTNSDEGES